MGGATSGASGQRHRTVWDVQRHGQQIRGVGLTPITTTVLGPNNAILDISLFASGTYALTGEWAAVGCRVVLSAAIAGHATDGYSFQVINNGVNDGATENSLTGTPESTLSADLAGVAAGEVIVVDVDGPGNTTPTNVYMLEGESLILRLTPLGTGPDLRNTRITTTLFVLNSPPSRTGLQQ